MVFRMKININVVPLWVSKMNFNIFNQLWKKKDVEINGQDLGVSSKSVWLILSYNESCFY